MQCGSWTVAGEVAISLVPVGNVSNVTFSYSGTITNVDDMVPTICGKGVFSLHVNMIIGNTLVHVYIYSSEHWTDGKLRGQIGKSYPDNVVAHVLPINELPPLNFAETGVTGLVKFAINEDRNVMGFILNTYNVFSIGLYDMAGAHIHFGASDENGPVVTTLGALGVMRDYTVTLVGVLTAYDIVDDTCVPRWKRYCQPWIVV
jgi:hypothetical protein